MRGEYSLEKLGSCFPALILRVYKCVHRRGGSPDKTGRESSQDGGSTLENYYTQFNSIDDQKSFEGGESFLCGNIICFSHQTFRTNGERVYLWSRHSIDFTLFFFNFCKNKSHRTVLLFRDNVTIYSLLISV